MLVRPVWPSHTFPTVTTKAVFHAINGVFIRLVYISPLALMGLLTFPELRRYGGFVIGAGVVLATLWYMFE